MIAIIFLLMLVVLTLTVIDLQEQLLENFPSPAMSILSNLFFGSIDNP